jgi:YesN/AraC family two-component response regulator
VPVSVSRFVCYKLVDLAMQVLNKWTARHQAPPPADIVSELLVQAVNNTSLVDFKERMYQLIDLICEYVAKVNEKREESMTAHVKMYVEEHYRVQGFSLDSIANKFGYSIYYWSRFFKEKIGCQFSEYVWNLRVNEAKRQFVETHKAFKEIIMEVGYLDLTSFTRKFKGEEGITPSQYRRLYANALPPPLGQDASKSGKSADEVTEIQ